MTVQIERIDYELEKPLFFCQTSKGLLVFVKFLIDYFSFSSHGPLGKIAHLTKYHLQFTTVKLHSPPERGGEVSIFDELLFIY